MTILELCKFHIPLTPLKRVNITFYKLGFEDKFDIIKIFF